MSGARRGSALVVVLLVSLVLAGVALSGAFIVALDAASARAAQRSVLASAAAEAALEIAAGGVLDALAAGAAVEPATLGPWPAVGIDARATITLAGDELVRIEAQASVGSTSAGRMLALRRDGVVVERP